MTAAAGWRATSAQPAQQQAAELCAGREVDSSARPPVDRTALDAFIDQLFEPGRVHAPGVAVVVMHEGRVVAQRAYAMASLEHAVPFTSNHVVRLPYSEGREFLAVAAVLMEHDGLMGLDDRVRDYFPLLPAWSAPVRIRDLIHHRSGFVDEWSTLLLMHASMANRLDRSQFLRLLSHQPAPEVAPGSGYMYSNSDYGLLRLILERAAGGDLAGYMKRRLFDPLRMHSTSLHDDLAAVVPHHAPFYAPAGDGYRHSTEVKTSPGGNYVVATTACDLARWADAHADTTSEIARAVVRLMDGATTLPGREGHYAFGHTIAQVNGRRVVRHEGVLECNYLTRIPELGYSVITFSNRYYDPEENRAVVRFLLGGNSDERREPFPENAVSVSADALARYAGRYVSTNIRSWESDTVARQMVTVTIAGDTLVARFPWMRAALVPVSAGSFSWHGDGAMLVQFSVANGAQPARMEVTYGDGTASESYVRLDPWTSSRELLERLTGTYHSAHLDYSWTIVRDSTGGLVVRAPTVADMPLEPFQENEFMLRHERYPGVPSHYWIRFHENDAGQITHLTVWAPRIMHHRFDRR